MKEEIELVDATPDMEDDYRMAVKLYIDLDLITLEEWNTKYKFYRDSCGYSMIHYLNCVVNHIDCFITINPIMLDNRKELIERFNVQIMTLEEAQEFQNDN